MTTPELVTRLRTYASLGGPAVLRAAGYRAGIRLGALERALPAGPPVATPRLRTPDGPATGLRRSTEHLAEIVAEAEAFLRGELSFYDGRHRDLGTPPHFLAPTTTFEPWPSDAHWTAVDEFAASDLDIKDVWEPSRFTWVIRAAAATAATGDPRYVRHANDAIATWAEQNPLHCGPNWKCGQEAALRLLHLLVAAEIVGGTEVPSDTVRFAEAHLNRISATRFYARAQDNDHVATEGAGLYVGGGWLLAQNLSARDRQRARAYRARGREALERTTHRLIASDGSFANYSLAYHRIVLDCLSWAEWARRRSDDAPFRDSFYDRFDAARRWLAIHMDPVSGGGPNLGSNDGGRLAPLLPSRHRDLRETTGRAELVRRSASTPSIESMLLPPPPGANARRSTLFDEGGTAVLVGPATGAPWALLRYARFQFRPAQADVGHVDLWHDGVAVLRDTGTYRYQAGARWLDYFGSTASHNTAQFDGREQMPRLSRFLYGDWLRTERVRLHDGGAGVTLSYRDGAGARHQRTVEVFARGARVVDELSGFERYARIRWHLAPFDWTLHGRELRTAGIRLTVAGPIGEIALEDGWESLRYGERTGIPVLCVTTHEPEARLVTTIEFTAGTSGASGD